MVYYYLEAILIPDPRRKFKGPVNIVPFYKFPNTLSKIEEMALIRLTPVMCIVRTKLQIYEFATSKFSMVKV